jgi:hypothetical protein
MEGIKKEKAYFERLRKADLIVPGYNRCCYIPATINYTVVLTAVIFALRKAILAVNWTFAAWLERHFAFFFAF